MINEVGPSTFNANGVGASAPVLATATGALIADVARAVGMIEGPLAATVQGLSARFATEADGARDTIGATRLETAMLDFAREAKALRIGNPVAAPSFIEEALAAGVAKSASLPEVGLNALDHATTVFAEAARSLAETPAAPLYDPAAVPNTRT
jgi:hypothetical protein